MRTFLCAAALAALPTLGWAATFTTDGIEGNFVGPIDIIGDVGQIDGTVGAIFGAIFEDSDLEQALRFDIINNTSAAISVALEFLFVEPCEFACGFAELSDDPGVSVRIETAFGTLDIAPLEGVFEEGIVVSIAPNDFFPLDFIVGDPFISAGDGAPLIGFAVGPATPIPLPASGLLLLGGAGVLGGLQRRKKRAGQA